MIRTSAGSIAGRARRPGGIVASPPVGPAGLAAGPSRVIGRQTAANRMMSARTVRAIPLTTRLIADKAGLQEDSVNYR
jgi:hypothetical protein